MAQDDPLRVRPGNKQRGKALSRDACALLWTAGPEPIPAGLPPRIWLLVRVVQVPRGAEGVRPSTADRAKTGVWLEAETQMSVSLGEGAPLLEALPLRRSNPRLVVLKITYIEV